MRLLIVALLLLAACSPPADPCAHLWNLPASDTNGRINFDSLDKIFDCYEAEGVSIETLCPPERSAWRAYVAPDAC